MNPVKTLLLSGGGYHDFPACSGILCDVMTRYEMVDVAATEDRDALRADGLDRYDAVVIHTQGGKLTAEQEEGLVGFVRNGGGLVALHSATDSFVESDAYVELIGSHFRSHKPLYSLSVDVKGVDHPMTARMENFEIFDELYTLERLDRRKVQVLATVTWGDQSEPVVYVKQEGAGRVCYIALGHGPEAFAHRTFQQLVYRAILHVVDRLPRRTLRTAVVGYGPAMGKWHINAADATPGLQPVALCDRLAQRVEAAREDFPDLNAYTDARALLEQEDFDLLTVVTPTGTHAAVAIQSLRAGRHTIVEKPMAITADECTAMIAESREAGRVLSVYQCRRWDGDYMVIRDQIRQGVIGDVFQAELCHGEYERPKFEWRSDKRISGGLFYDWGAHFVDWVLGLVPHKILAVEGFFHKNRWLHVTTEDHAHLTIRFEHGVMAHIEHSNVAAVHHPKWRILGTTGGILVGEFQPSTIDVVTEADGRLIRQSLPVPERAWDRYYANVADHLIYGEPLAVSPESARRVIAVIETAGKASHSGGPLPPPCEDDHAYDRWAC